MQRAGSTRRMGSAALVVAAAVGGVQLGALGTASADESSRQPSSKATRMAQARSGAAMHNSATPVAGSLETWASPMPTPGAASLRRSPAAAPRAATVVADPTGMPAVFNPDRPASTTFSVTVDVDDPAPTIQVQDGLGATVRDLSQPLVAGANDVAWDGKNGATPAGTVADGTYTLVVTSAGNPDVPAATVRVDTVRPMLDGQTASTGFYPYPDSYLDYAYPAVSLSEAATLRLTVFTTTTPRRAVRIVTAGKPAGRVSIPWDGRTGGGAVVPAGTYTYEYVATDGAGNVSGVVGGTIGVSAKRLVAKTAVYRQAAGRAQFLTTERDCAGIDTTLSAFPGGVWLYNGCSAPMDSEAVLMRHMWTLPAATRLHYSVLRLYGSSDYVPTELTDGAYSFRERKDLYHTDYTKVTSSGRGYVTFDTVPLSGFYDANRRMRTSVAVPNTSPPDDFDVAFVLLYVRYSVLQ